MDTRQIFSILGCALSRSREKAELRLMVDMTGRVRRRRCVWLVTKIVNAKYFEMPVLGEDM